jgi:hypothetical protein
MSEIIETPLFIDDSPNLITRRRELGPQRAQAESFVALGCRLAALRDVQWRAPLRDLPLKPAIYRPDPTLVV